MTNIELTLDDKNIRALLNALSKRCEDASGVMKNIAKEMSKSVDENFEVGGRYSSPDSMIGGKKKWKPLSKVTEAIKKRLNDIVEGNSNISNKHINDTNFMHLQIMKLARDNGFAYRRIAR